MSDVVSILDELQNKALKDEKLPVGNLVMNYMKWN